MAKGFQLRVGFALDGSDLLSGFELSIVYTTLLNVNVLKQQLKTRLCSNTF